MPEPETPTPQPDPQAAEPRQQPAQRSTRHPGDDTMPPYTPGGVPEPERDEKGNPDRIKPSYPPKLRP